MGAADTGPAGRCARRRRTSPRSPAGRRWSAPADAQATAVPPRPATRSRPSVGWVAVPNISWSLTETRGPSPSSRQAASCPSALSAPPAPTGRARVAPAGRAWPRALPGGRAAPRSPARVMPATHGPSQSSSPASSPPRERSGRSASPCPRSHDTLAAKRSAAGVHGSTSIPRSRTPSRKAAATRSAGGSVQARSSRAIAPEHQPLARNDPPLPPRPLADEHPPQAVGVQRPQVALRHRQRQPNARLARVAVEVRCDKPGRARERISLRERRALAP